MSYHSDKVQPVKPVATGFLPTVPAGGTAMFALIGVGLAFAYMVLKPKRKNPRGPSKQQLRDEVEDIRRQLEFAKEFAPGVHGNLADLVETLEGRLEAAKRRLARHPGRR